jgi:hypothetical protein
MLYPIAHVLVDCCEQERDAEFLEHAISALSLVLQSCEINFCAYQCMNELVEICVQISHDLQATDHPMQLVWVSAGGLAPLEEDGALAVLALYDTMRERTSASLRSIIVHPEADSDLVLSWSSILDAESLPVEQITENAPLFANDMWRVGWLDMEEFTFQVYSHLSDHICPLLTGRIIGTIDGLSVEPYKETLRILMYKYFAKLIFHRQGDMCSFEQRTMLLSINDRLFFGYPSNMPSSYHLQMLSDCFADSILKRAVPYKAMTGKRRSSTDSQISIISRSQLSQPASLQCTPPEDHNEPKKSIKDKNKAALKKLLLLALRKAGISRSSKEFTSTWKHLYCGCVFSLRKELDRMPIDQTTLISVIQSNMRTFNIK